MARDKATDHRAWVTWRRTSHGTTPHGQAQYADAVPNATFKSVEELQQGLAGERYLADRGLATAS